MINRAFLYAVIGLIEGSIWWSIAPIDRPEWMLPTEFGVLAAISTFALAIRFTGQEGGRRGISCSLVLALIIGAITIRVASLLPLWNSPYEGDGARLLVWLLGSFVALYISMPFVQIFTTTERLRFPYPPLFEHTWNNLFVGIVALLFTGALWVLLSVWAALFAMIGIDVFSEFFFSKPFGYIGSFTAFGYGLAVGRASEGPIATLRRITLLMAQFLLPLISLVTLLFLAALPFTGLDPLWRTGSATPLLIGLLGLLALSLNAIYEDGTTPAPGRWLQALARAAALTMPAYAAIALYATSLRARQYGLTPDRVYAFAMVAIAAVFSFGYGLAAFRKRDRWMRGMEITNVIGACVVAFVAIGIALPPLDPFRLSAADQFRRFASGRVAVADFDFGALRFDMGHYGWERLREIEELETPEAADARRAIAEVRAATSQWDLKSPGPKLTAAAFARVPETLDVPTALLLSLAPTGRSVLSGCSPDRCLLFGVDLDANGQEERCAIAERTEEHGPDLYAHCYALDEYQTWQSIGRLANLDVALSFSELKHQLQLSGPVLRPSRYREIQIGSGALVLTPDAPSVQY